MDDEKTPQQMAAEVIGAHFDVDDSGTASMVDQLAAALDEAGLLIDPVDNGMWQNLRAGHMTCRYEDGQLLFRITEAGTQAVRDMVEAVDPA